METATVAKAHFESIEPVVVKLIGEAKSSIFIVMAWLTSKVVKRALLRAKHRNPELIIEIVVDDNEINDQCFLDTENDFSESGIIIIKKVDGRFLHRKFMIVDETFTLLGSYNYTGKAKRNAENVALIKDAKFNAVHRRVFRAITDHCYLDENIQLLFDYPDFAQKILSAYYPFSREQFKRHKDKIINGDCFTHENGMYDEIKYEPGFIFNPRCWMNRKLLSGEFKLPINKEILKNWTGKRNENLIIDGYKDSPEFYDEIGEQIEHNWDAVGVFFHTLFDTTYTYKELKKMVRRGVDIIIEDRLWPDNFALFLNEQWVDKLFDQFPEVKNNYDDYDWHLQAKRMEKNRAI
jgi:hypothetical protein